MPPKFYKKKSVEISSANISSAKYLIIVESPSKCAKIEHFLGTEYACIASKGHIRGIEGMKSIDTKKTFEPAFSILKEKKEHVEKMRAFVNRFSPSCIFLATDDDREGEAISWHICQVFNLPVDTTPRILFHEITKNAVTKAVQNPGKINMTLVLAQHARQVLDILVGYKVSPYLWRYLYNNKSNSLSAGRCQTPALRLVYDNENEKTQADLEHKYKTSGVFTARNIPFVLNHEFDNEPQVADFLKSSQKFSHMISVQKPKESRRSPPKPFHTSRLLQTASNILHMSPKETMSLCQMLYQSGHITYMRTESSQYAKPFLEDAKGFIIKTWGSEKYVGDLNALENKNSANPHEAIRVTHIETTYIKTDDDNSRMASLYKLIWKNTVESCMTEYKYNAVETQISAPMNYHYSHTIEIPVFLGWKTVTQKDDVTTIQTTETGTINYLTSLMPNPASYKHIESTVVVRNRHSHYTESSLIQKLEDEGIGRPSTFASIVDTILERGYVKKCDLEGKVVECKEYKLENGVVHTTLKSKTFGNEKNKLVIQPVGKMTIEFLLKYFEPLFDYEYTKNMETELDSISSGITKDWSSICKNCYDEIKSLSKNATQITKQVFEIEDGYDFVFEKFGPVIRHKLSNGEFEYFPAKKNVNYDLEKLKNKEYTLDELIEIKNSCLGIYDSCEIFIKDGKFGAYVEWGDKRESIKDIDKPLSDIVLEDVVAFLDKKEKGETKNVLRVLNKNMSVRRGKFGAYVFYQTPAMKKPQFLNIKSFKEGFLGCDADVLVKWCCDKYKL